MNSRFLAPLRRQNPLIHNLTNPVSAWLTANGLLSLGASPLMADCIGEAAELAAQASAVVINLGMPDPDTAQAMLAAGQAANRAGVPVVLDPVAAGASRLRRDTVRLLLDQVHFAAIRGNAAEITYLSGMDWQGKGVDGGTAQHGLAAAAAETARRYGCAVALTGRQDYVSDGSRCVRIDNGTALLPKITASGCLLSAVCGAFLAVAPADGYWEALAEACTVYAVAGEQAADGLDNSQSGSFLPRFLDALGSITPEDVECAARVAVPDGKEAV